MSDAPPVPVPPEVPEDDDRARTFPCPSCGGDLTFDIGVQSLKCPYCGAVHALEHDPEAAVEEQDFEATMKRLAELRSQGRDESADLREIDCEACGSTVRFTGTLTSSECTYCGSPIQIENAHTAPHRVPVDGILSFRVDRKAARTKLRAWVRSLWFAPNDFKQRGIDGRFNGVYLPFWTYDALTHNAYRGERGEVYHVTVGSGKNRRRVRKVRWYPASGRFKRFFDDVLVPASTGLPHDKLDKLEPWPFTECEPFDAKMLAGFLARTYDVELDAGFESAKSAIDEAVLHDVRRRIGGDVQRVHSIKTVLEAVTYKHLLLPVWILAYRYKDKAYRVLVNAATGEVQGERPWSALKIGLAVAAVAIVAAIVYWLRG